MDTIILTIVSALIVLAIWFLFILMYLKRKSNKNNIKTLNSNNVELTNNEKIITKTIKIKVTKKNDPDLHNITNRYIFDEEENKQASKINKSENKVDEFNIEIEEETTSEGFETEKEATNALEMIAELKRKKDLEDQKIDDSKKLNEEIENKLNNTKEENYNWEAMRNMLNKETNEKDGDIISEEDLKKMDASEN